MKMKALLISSVLFTAILSSCVSNSYYQVYKVSPIGKTMKSDSSLVYEDNNCKISYNLWKDGGDMSFYFHNKTEDNIYLDLGESFFVLNGISYDYFKDRTFASTSS